MEKLRTRYGKDLPDHKLMRLLEMELAPKKNYSTYRSGAIRNMTGRNPVQAKSKETYQPDSPGSKMEAGDAATANE